MPIEVNYSGPYSQKLIWDEKEMDQWIRRGDVRTQIYVRSQDLSSKAPGIRVRNEVFIGNDEFREDDLIQEENELFNVSFDANKVRGEVAVYPQRIMSKVLEENNNYFTPSDFAKKLNFAIKGGAKIIAKQEYKYRIAHSAFGGSNSWLIFFAAIMADTNVYSNFVRALGESDRYRIIFNGAASLACTFLTGSAAGLEMKRAQIDQSQLNSSYFSHRRDITIFPDLYHRALLELPSNPWIKIIS